MSNDNDKKKYNSVFNEALLEFFSRQSKNRFLSEHDHDKGLVQERRLGSQRVDVRDLMPTIKITEAWGKLGNADRAVVEKFTAALGGAATTVDQKLRNINNIINGDKENYSISEILTVMMVVETLTAILQEFTEAAGGFIFEGFLAGLFGGQSVQIESPEDLEAINEAEEEETDSDDDQEGKPITDVYLDTPEGKKHYSLKLLGPTTAVKGSFKNMIKHFQAYDHVIYLDARIDKETRSSMHFSEFTITLDRFLDVFYLPFQKFVTKTVSVNDIGGIGQSIADLREAGFSIKSVKFRKFPPSSVDIQRFGIQAPDGYNSAVQGFSIEDSEPVRAVLAAIADLPDPESIDYETLSYTGPLNTPRRQGTAKNRLVKLKDRIAGMFPATVSYSEESLDKNPKAQKLFGTTDNLTRVRQDLEQFKKKEKTREEVTSWLLTLPGATGKQQFSFTPEQVRKIGTYREVGPEGGLVVGKEALMRIWDQYANVLETTIEPIYTNLNEFTRNINSYFLTVGKVSDRNASASRLQHGQEAIRDAKELHTASYNVVHGLAESQESRDARLEKAGEAIQDLYRGKGHGMYREQKEKEKEK